MKKVEEFKLDTGVRLDLKGQSGPLAIDGVLTSVNTTLILCSSTTLMFSRIVLKLRTGRTRGSLMN